MGEHTIFGEEGIFEIPRETQAIAMEHGTKVYSISFKVPL